MINIFVTVGTTPFDSLIQQLDVLAKDCPQFNITAQVSNFSNYEVKNFSSFQFSSDIDDYICNSQLVITHAGAGSVYRLLELEKTVLVVPNVERIDKHQIEIANFVESQNYASVCYDIDKLKEAIDKALLTTSSVYRKVDFFGETMILGELI